MRSVLTIEQNFNEMLIAEDLTRRPVTVTEDETLASAIRKIAANDLDEVIVVAPDNPKRQPEAFDRDAQR